MFQLELLPAREGDCLLLTWGPEDAPLRALIDGGRAATYGDLKEHVSTIPAGERTFELLVVTHVDRDHIEGVLKMLADPQRPLRFKEAWFNGYHHLADEDFESFGAVQGEGLTRELKRLHGAGETTWNESFGADFQKAVAVAADGDLIEVESGGATWTLLSPTRAKLRDMIDDWERECEAAGLVAGTAARDPDPEGFESFGPIDIAELAEEPFKEDPGDANGTSIAAIVEYAGKRVLLSGDAHPSVLAESLRRFGGGRPVRLDAFKVPHHGSRKNVSKELLALLDCKRYLFSTNGSYFDHPDRVAVSRVIRYGGDDVELWFNYKSPETAVWDVEAWQEEHGYSVHYPSDARDGYLRLDLAR